MQSRFHVFMQPWATVAWKKHSKSRFGLFDLIATQNIPVETYFILILKTRIARLEGSRLEGLRLEGSKFTITHLRKPRFFRHEVHDNLIIYGEESWMNAQYDTRGIL